VLNGQGTLTEYDRRVRDEIGCEIVWSRKLLSFFVTFPAMIHEIFRRNDKVWTAFCRVLRGEESFRVFRRKKFGVLEFLWVPIDAFTTKYEQRRLRRLENGTGGLMENAGRLVGSLLKKI